MIKTSTAPYAALLLRVSLGVMFLAHVGLKIFVFSIPGVVGYFGSLGLPAVVAYAVIALELFGGVALILGVYAPWRGKPGELAMTRRCSSRIAACNRCTRRPRPASPARAAWARDAVCSALGPGVRRRQRA